MKGTKRLQHSRPIWHVLHYM